MSWFFEHWIITGLALLMLVDNIKIRIEKNHGDKAPADDEPKQLPEPQQLGVHIESICLSLATRPQDWNQSAYLTNLSIDVMLGLKGHRIESMVRPTQRSLSKREREALENAWERGLALKTVDKLDALDQEEFDRRLKESQAEKTRIRERIANPEKPI